MKANEGVKEASFKAIILRCTCKPEKMKHSGKPCPRAKAVDLGVVSYYHKNPIRRLIWEVKNKLRDKKDF